MRGAAVAAAAAAAVAHCSARAARSHARRPDAPHLRCQGGVNFALQSAGATGVKLVLFSEADLAAGRSSYEITLDPGANKTGDVWHIALPGLQVRGARAGARRSAAPHCKALRCMGSSSTAATSSCSSSTSSSTRGS